MRCDFDFPAVLVCHLLTGGAVMRARAAAAAGWSVALGIEDAEQLGACCLARAAPLLTLRARRRRRRCRPVLFSLGDEAS
jgi:hypothetical protein